jgi:predicted TIM-barrel fold metal-dependent hydrolase
MWLTKASYFQDASNRPQILGASAYPLALAHPEKAGPVIESVVKARSMKIDAHQHFWRSARNDYGWLLAAAQTVAETEFLLALARETAFVTGVVGWVDFTAQDVVDQIARLATDPLLVGLHPMVQDKILPITTGSCEPI